MQRRRKPTEAVEQPEPQERQTSSSQTKSETQREEETLLGSGVVIPIAIGVVLRVLCFVYARPFLLKRPELTSPLVSYRRLKDGIAMYRDGISPYEGDLFHFQPMVLRLFSLISLDESAIFGAFMLFDCAAAVLLSISARRYAEESGSVQPGHIARTVFKWLVTLLRE
ncbi:unnamed protein product [Heligmosomoides polygyrus]|uniref:GPI mannosyltransferase 2 n=1 Tax=Heligmosomoides polygyrus TaxID=6339 RepID=A0A183FVX8_HELPZ|nr:unnamed protein product [Heligmosomoides polygyrus]